MSEEIREGKLEEIEVNEHINVLPDWSFNNEHKFTIQKLLKPRYCQVCRTFLWGITEALSCEVCSLWIHPKCQETLKIACYEPKKVDGHDYTQSIVFTHHWLPGNAKLRSKCIVCTKASDELLSGGFDSLSCSACHALVHEKCINSAPPCKKPLAEITFCHDLMRNAYQNYTPLLVFVNGKSGGKRGPEMIPALRKLLTTEQVVDLFDHKPVGPLQALEKYVHVPHLRILVCGGDGTACWILSVLDNMENLPETIPPLGVLPLGTGNDLARVLRFGGGYDGEPLLPILESIRDRGTLLSLNRWNIEINEEGKGPRMLTMNNYFSIGLDASIALQFHEMRETNPALFSSRLFNKGVYGTLSLSKIVIAPESMKELDLQITVDNVKIELKEMEHIQCVVFLNLPSYAGGTNPWLYAEGEGKWVPCCMNDEIIEVVGLKNAAHLLSLQTGFIHGVKIAQGSKIEISVNSAAVQVDGEPFRIANSKISISYFKSNLMISLSDAPKKLKKVSSKKVASNSRNNSNNNHNHNHNHNHHHHHGKSNSNSNNNNNNGSNSSNSSSRSNNISATTDSIDIRNSIKKDLPAKHDLI